MRFVLAVWMVTLRCVYVTTLLLNEMGTSCLLCLSGCALWQLLRGCLLTKTSYHVFIVLVRLHP
jgi:hypothetical protein